MRNYITTIYVALDLFFLRLKNGHMVELKPWNVQIKAHHSMKKVKIQRNIKLINVSKMPVYMIFNLIQYLN